MTLAEFLEDLQVKTALKPEEIEVKFYEKLDGPNSGENTEIIEYEYFGGILDGRDFHLELKAK